MRIRKLGTSAVLSAVIAALLLAGAGTARADEMKVPSSADEYVAMAKEYRAKAASYRKEAQEHRDMAAAAKKVPTNAEAHGQKNPAYEKIVQHCKAIATKADALAAENEKAADFYELRAKELQGNKP